MQKVAWLALRQIEAIRESVAFTLEGGAVDRGTGKSEEFFAEWLRSQNVVPFYYRHMPEDKYVLSILGTIERGIATHGINTLRVGIASAHSRFDEPDLGPDRSSTGWDRLPNFITSSALIRILGAMEQFEMDVLKALLHYRPSGKLHVAGSSEVDVALSVVCEKEDKDGRFSSPALWSWLKKSAENSVERRRIYKSVFDIDCYPEKFGSRSPSSIRSYYQELYERRNGLAHGRTLVEVTLAEYCEAEAFALTLIDDLSKKCAERYGLRV
jgi:hypothetical protein